MGVYIITHTVGVAFSFLHLFPQIYIYNGLSRQFQRFSVTELV